MASITPTSRFAITHLCKLVDFARPVTLVEFGPGIGNVAQALRERMSPTSRLLLIEANHEFVVRLRERFAGDGRVIIVHGLAQDALRLAAEHDVALESVDVVFANIPFTFFDEEVRWRIVRGAKDLLKHGGIFVAFPFTAVVRPYMRRTFAYVQEYIFWKNLPPLRIFIGQKEV